MSTNFDFVAHRLGESAREADHNAAIVGGGSLVISGVAGIALSILCSVPAIIASLVLPALEVSAFVTGTIVTIAAIVPSVIAVASLACIIFGTIALNTGSCATGFTCCLDSFRCCVEILIKARPSDFNIISIN